VLNYEKLATTNILVIRKIYVGMALCIFVAVINISRRILYDQKRGIMRNTLVFSDLRQSYIQHNAVGFSIALVRLEYMPTYTYKAGTEHPLKTSIRKKNISDRFGLLRGATGPNWNQLGPKSEHFSLS
jgi:hypothetical protein